LKAVITCGGTGSRLLPFSKELPKEMAPIFYNTEEGVLIKPLIQQIFENLYDSGIRDFCFVSGRTKRAIENHFTPHQSKNNTNFMKSFFEKLDSSKIFWVTQNSPNGFGDAVKYAESFVDSENFILQAGDVAVLKNKIDVISELITLSKKSNYDAIISIRKVSDPERHGIVTLENQNKISSVLSAIEKPDKPQSDLGIMPIYVFNSTIFSALKKIQPTKNNEIQLTDAISYLIENGKKVLALRVDGETFWDVGTPESYWNALNESYHYKE